MGWSTQSLDPSKVVAAGGGGGDDDGPKSEVSADGEGCRARPNPPPSGPPARPPPPPTPSFSAVDLCIRIATVRALLWTRASRGQARRQCRSISTQPGVLANTLTKAGVMERLRNTRHPRLRMDLFAWKVFMARMVSRAIWQMCAWMEEPSPSFALLADIRGRGRKEGRKEGECGVRSKMIGKCEKSRRIYMVRGEAGTETTSRETPPPS